MKKLFITVGCFIFALMPSCEHKHNISDNEDKLQQDHSKMSNSKEDSDIRR